MEVDVAGVELRSPAMLASGVLGSTAASLNRVLDAGAGGVVTKSVGPRPREGHPGPNVYTEDGYAMNAVGLSNPSFDYVDEARDVEGPLVVSVYGSTADEFADLADAFGNVADALELNVSCPHAEGYGTDIGADPALTREVTEAAVDAADVPVWTKLTPNVTDVAEIGRAAERGGASAVTAVNTLAALSVDVESKRPILGNVHGGLSGSALKPVGVRCVWELYEALSIPVVGVGGVSNVDDAVEYVLAGASAVQIGTAAKDGLDVFERVDRGVEDYLERHDLTYGEAVGLAHERAGEAGA